MTLSQASTSRTPKLRGFTLMELILVLTLLTIIVTAVVPNFRLFSVGRQAKYSATQFLALTRYARTQAIGEGRTHRINFDDAAFWVTVDDGSGLFIELPNEYGRKYDLPTGVKMTIDIAPKENISTTSSTTTNTNNNALATGRVLDFTPDGLGDVGRVTFTSAAGEATEVLSEAPSDLYRIIDPKAATPAVAGGVR